MRLARKMKRKAMKSAVVGEQRAVKDVARVKSAVRHATTREIVVKENIRLEAMTNIMVTMDVTVNRAFGWGRKNILRMRKKMHSQMECIKRKYVTVEELEDIIRDELDIDFRIKPDSADWDMSRRVQYGVVREMSAIFILALRDEFGMGTKRTERAYQVLADIWDDINAGNVTIADMRAERDAIGRRTARKTVGGTAA